MADYQISFKHQDAFDMNPVFQNLFTSYPELQACSQDLQDAFLLLCKAYRKKRKLLICGNGGSAADSQHIVGELMKGFRSKRPLPTATRRLFEERLPDSGAFLASHLQGVLPAISLSAHAALTSAIGNDVSAEMVYAQQVYGYGQHRDVLLAISTSGNSANIIRASEVAKVIGLQTIGLTGQEGGKLVGLCDITIRVPRIETYQVQELHLPVYHALCMALEDAFFSEKQQEKQITESA